jgi:hypothetical protein
MKACEEVLKFLDINILEIVTNRTIIVFYKL